MTISIGAVTLPDDLLWQDEFAHDPVAQQLTRTEGGALIVEESAITAGRPITLVGARDAAWITRAQLLALRTLADAANSEHLLTLNDGRTFGVMFARPNAVAAEPVVAYSTPANADFYTVTVRMITV